MILVKIIKTFVLKAWSGHWYLYVANQLILVFNSVFIVLIGCLKAKRMLYWFNIVSKYSKEMMLRGYLNDNSKVQSYQQVLIFQGKIVQCMVESKIISQWTKSGKNDRVEFPSEFFVTKKSTLGKFPCVVTYTNKLFSASFAWAGFYIDNLTCVILSKRSFGKKLW